MFRSALAIGFALSIPLSASAKELQSARPLGNPGEWIAAGDYPASALGDNIEGTVGFTVFVAAEGHAERCEVTVSSGSDLLDDTACNLITLRARFSPAMDERGKPIAGTYSNRVKWVLPREMRKFQPSVIEGTFVIDADGSISGCELTNVIGLSDEERAMAEKRLPCSRGFSVAPFLDDGGKPVRKRVRMRQSIDVEPAP